MQTQQAKPVEAQETQRPPVIVIGGGPVGVRAAAALSAGGADVLIFNAESFEPYNRVKLTPLLAGDVQLGEISLPMDFPGPGKVSCFSGLRIKQIDPAAHKVVSADGGIWQYSKLVIATGSSAFIPNIPGRFLPGVYAFRDAADTSALIARSFSSRKVVVIGGGLLGLEAARGMQRRGAEVTIVEHETRLMPRQLDDKAAALLAEKIETLGVAVRVGEGVAEIFGEHRVSGIHLRSGEEIACDTVIICTGVRANIALAREAQLPVGRGILVDDQMRTSDPDIFAVGECAEHKGIVHGLVGPGLEQADSAAKSILGEGGAYAGSTPATKLKVIGADVFSMGEIENLEQNRNTRSYLWQKDGEYRRIFITRGKLTGALGIGPWDEASRIQQAVTARSTVYPWMIYRFRREGLLWEPEPQGAAALPAEAIVCNCTGVTCGRLRECMKGGARSVEALKLQTGASTICGSCKPLIEELLASGGPAEPVRLWKPILIASLIAGLLALITAIAPRIPVPTSYSAFSESLAHMLWFDSVTKQWSGYILLGITGVAAVIGLRKRIRFLHRLGGYDWWRLAHLVIGFAAVIGLFAHTGFRPGANLNFALFFAFCASLIFGAIAGMATGGEHRLRDEGFGSAQKPPRSVPIWLHVLALWPLPALLIAHVLAVYAY
ncbi:MAG: FAD-dependent oxidoreductase [Neomegalonema sp.]|nr:FAD-dependent oxidoreductase [Neomegalonema sp.]